MIETEAKEEVLDRVLSDILKLLEDLYQSGFDTVHDSTLEALQEAGKATEQYGMTCLSDLLRQLSEGLSMRRHQLERKEDALAGLYTGINEYIYLCRQKAAYDRGRSYYL